MAHIDDGTGVPGVDVQAEWGCSPRSIGKADNGWDVDPPGFYGILQRMRKVTEAIPIEITQNGAADNSPAAADGRFHDTRRIAFLRAHLAQLHRAIADGVPVRGYHLWSLLDDLEWAEGYPQRFGRVHVDFDHEQKRTVRDLGRWYAQLARTTMPA